MLRQFYTSLFTILICCRVLSAQDLHSAQPALAAAHFNPATAGMFHGTLRVAARYRAQWLTVPVNYRTFAAEADMPILERGSTRLAGGIRVAHDQAGDGQLNFARGGFMVSGMQRLSKSLAVSVGADVSFAQRSVQLNGLKFKNQWLGDIYDPTAPNKEQLGAKTGTIPLLSAGLAVHFGQRENPRQYLEIGAAMHQINSPMVSFDANQASKLAPRLVAHAAGATRISTSLDVVGFAQFQSQGPYRSVLTGTGVRTILGTDGDFLCAVQTTISYRLGDAVIPTIQLDWGAWNVGLSYDINTSAFQTATNRRGAWELACVYKIVPAPPVPEFKVCPVF
jgi:type IX secretion system PorP/SprF family membrane protein